MMLNWIASLLDWAASCAAVMVVRDPQVWRARLAMSTCAVMDHTPQYLPCEPQQPWLVPPMPGEPEWGPPLSGPLVVPWLEPWRPGDFGSMMFFGPCGGL